MSKACNRFYTYGKENIKEELCINCGRPYSEHFENVHKDIEDTLPTTHTND